MGEFFGSSLEIGLEAMIGQDCRMILLDAPSIESNPGVQEIVNLERPETGAYSRKTIASPTATFDSGQDRAEVPGLSATFTVASNQPTLTFNAIALLADTSTWANKLIDSLNAAMNRITLSSHGLSDGDLVSLTADTGGTVPTELVGLLLTVTNATTNDFQLSDEDGVIDFGGTGILPVRVRNCQGRLVYAEQLSAQQILPGESRTITLFPTLGRSTANLTNP
ncbi:hypothetical protein NIES2135_53280 [Leptolyngbya boryana NIES-2135]|jgi:hypothetical protein|uniref:Uncharacterized protein n=1 Tax=Leptolyngbya boryana NIES-2135 TaxID=1973484 RepID=A0A1Z4JNW6_LEPBY|nr:MULTISPECIES: hypothetical protein [Leptolyngbya]BAY58455.1 hypothetical protein NIES2135_53280 [Leptolyngbya boryana NIES-2135]MBD2370928.1 hypothetical protein [Leptolyngbya sp. FACHB-161]MBD2377442.1 hypothetical protein [Leptolyngbya sp. FACHB-238]MBD2401850.1 hypothetical protein [Leptolyngbya sp. FACHB-239]MBD2408368.1 hypothetical protein [Leptolyngbya sp. FACHB-402]